MTRRWIPIIINPASTRRVGLLSHLNNVFTPAGIHWTVEVTLGEGDAVQIARRLAADGAETVAVYGGDGTISETAWGLAGTDTSLAILPGGTGNVLAFEFGIPRRLAHAARLLIGPHRTRKVDVGEVNGPSGSRKFMLRVGAGVEAHTIQRAPRELKERLGLMAYGLAGIQALLETRPVFYRLEFNGHVEEAQGVVCSVANAGHLGVLPGLNLPPVDIEDGLLDIIILTRVDLENIFAILSRKLEDRGALGNLRHWQVQQARIFADPAQPTQVDGDNQGSTPMEVRCLPRALNVIVPIH